MDQRRQQQQQQSVHSPIDFSSKRHLERANTTAARKIRRDRPKPIISRVDLTSPKLKYLDDDDEQEEETTTTSEGKNIKHEPRLSAASEVEQPSRVFFEKCNNLRPNSSKSSTRSHQQQVSNKSGNSVKRQPGSNNQRHHHQDDYFIDMRRQQKREPQQGDNEDEFTIRNASSQEEEFDTHDEQETRSEASLEEVYLCSCCGVTRPLNPAMKYMPLFRGAFLLFNFLAFALGFANLSMGLWFRIDPKVYEIHKYIETQNFTYAGYILLVAGCLGCLMALAGFAAAARPQNKLCLLISYALTMTLLTVALIGALVLLTVYGLGSHLERFMNKEIYEQIRRRTMSTELDLLQPTTMGIGGGVGDAAQFLDFIQVKLRCCGAQDWRDYQKLGMVVPTTCYTIAANYINAPGCGRALRELFDLRAGLAAGTTAASVVAQLVAALLASLMVCSIYNYRANPRPASAAYPRRGHSMTPPTPTQTNIGTA